MRFQREFDKDKKMGGSVFNLSDIEWLNAPGRGALTI